jgi:hypothetical protein
MMLKSNVHLAEYNVVELLECLWVNKFVGSGKICKGKYKHKDVTLYLWGKKLEYDQKTMANFTIRKMLYWMLQM